ncbi:hypothetical protein OAV05_00580 [Flavobacteriaceae bacterium]|nr:hypothetical protein [Flavobacteriaceae bacterium]
MKIKKRISIILMTFQMLLGVIAFGQENNNKNKNLKNTVFVEALGNGLFGSINYERQLTKEPGLSLSAGIGFYTEYDFYLTLPFSIQYLIDLNRNNFIETGIGYTWADAGADDIFNNKSVKNSDNLNNLFLSVG